MPKTHPLQRAMWERVEWILSRIEESGSDGIAESTLYALVFNTLHCQARTCRQYLDNLIIQKRIRRVTNPFNELVLISENFARIQEEQSRQTKLEDSTSIHIQRTDDKQHRLAELGGDRLDG